MFDMVDADGNGSLGYEEMSVFFKMMGRKQTEMRAMYRDVDGDGNGKVSFSEFTEWFKRDILHTKMKGAPNAIRQAENTWLGLKGKEKRIKEQIEADRQVLAEIKEQERVARDGSNACANRLRESRALQKKLDGLMTDAFHQTCATREILKNVRRSASHRQGGTDLYLATGHQRKRRGKQEDLMNIVTSGSMGSLKENSLRFRQQRDRKSPLSMVHSQTIMKSKHRPVKMQ
jgi:hypothetical protein